MQYPAELPETRAASWAAGLATASWILGVLTILASLVGVTSVTIFLGGAALAVGVAAWVTAHGAHAHHVAANIALVLGVVGVAIGVQSVYLGSGL